MDPGTLAGVALGFVAIFASMILEGGKERPNAVVVEYEDVYRKRWRSRLELVPTGGTFESGRSSHTAV